MRESGEDLLLVGGPAGILGLIAYRDIVLRGVARDLDTPQEAVLRISLVQRTLLLAQFLLAPSK